MIFLILYQDETPYEDLRLEVTREELENAQKAQQLEEIKQQTKEAQRAQESIARQCRRETLRARRDLIYRWAIESVCITLSFNSGSYSLFLL
jgi:serine phosphatase RsbU (regulator of sigma subunit)